MTKANSTEAGGKPHQSTVLLVEDHPLVSEVLETLLNRQSDFQVAGRVETIAGARLALARLRPEIMVLDLGLPDGHGLEFIKDVRAQSAEPRILVFTSYDEAIFALRALRAGANGFVKKQAPMADFLNAIRQIAAGNYAVNPQVWTRFLNGAAPEPSNEHDTAMFTRLTDRELEVFELIGKGAGTREIAAYLNRSVSAIEACRINIKEKLQMRNYSELVCHAVKWTDCQEKTSG